jgi:Predicted periplasmic ligand-binding sensor domain
MRKNPLLVGFVILLALAIPASSQDRLRCQNFSLEEGLSQSSSFCIAQDRRGFLWIGTETGLNRYDGYNFKVYLEDRENPRAISNNYVWCLLEAQDGTLWVGTDNGLSRYVPETDDFVNYRPDPGNADSLSNNRIFALAQDHSGFIWIATDEGLNRLDPATGIFTRYLAGPGGKSGLSHNSIHALLVDRSGVLWIGTDGGGLNRWNEKPEHSTPSATRSPIRKASGTTASCRWPRTRPGISGWGRATAWTRPDPPGTASFITAMTAAIPSA